MSITKRIVTATLTGLLSTAALAQSETEKFFAGKNIDFLIGSAPGGRVCGVRSAVDTLPLAIRTRSRSYSAKRPA